MMLPISLTIAGAAAFLNIWLMIRVGQVRTSEKVSVGDGGNDKVIRRMRAHSNYVETAPFVLILIGLVEMTSTGETSPTWLLVVGGVYLLSRIAHGIGMDGEKFHVGRTIGTVVTMLTMLGLGIYAVVIPYLGG